jgi:hypothetical protein
MVLTKNNELGFFEGDFKIEIVFYESENTFEEFEDIFRFFNEFDKLYYQYSLDNSYQRNIKGYKRTQVLEISKKSPLNILVFIDQHWFEIMLFLLSTNRESIILNVTKHYQDFNRLIDSIEDKFNEITEDFPGFEREEIIKFIRWFDDLTVEQKYYIVQLLKRSQKVMNKIRKIFKK